MGVSAPENGDITMTMNMKRQFEVGNFGSGVMAIQQNPAEGKAVVKQNSGSLYSIDQKISFLEPEIAEKLVVE